MWYYIVACWLENKKMFAIYPRHETLYAPDVDKVVAYIRDADMASNFVRRVLNGRIHP